MIKAYLTFAMWVGICLLLSAQSPVFECDFSQGIPGDFTLVDKDGATPDHLHTDFPVNTAWDSRPDPNDAENTVACSTSLYTDRDATSDDWMILPAIELPEEPVSLFWRTRSAYNTYKDGYKVYISTDKEDLMNSSSITRKELIYVPRELEKWNSHEVKLSEFAGKTVYIAFQNCANMGWFLYLDDVTIGTKEDVRKVELEITSDRYAEDNKGVVSASIKTGILTTITNFTARITCDDISWEQTFKGLSIVPNQKYEFTLDKRLEGKAPETKTYTVDILLNEEKIASQSASFTYLLNVDNVKRIVGEAVTATWEGYGPRVIEGMAMMDKKYPEDFLGICVHGYGSEDPMSISGDSYLNALKAKGADYNKVMLLDRDLKGEPYKDIESLYKSQKKIKAFVGVSVIGTCDDEFVKASVETRFALDLTNLNYRCLLVLSENGIRGSSSDYHQSNIYSSGYFGEFLDYKKKPSLISEIEYNHVARVCYPSDEGENCFPETVAADDTITNEYQFDIPVNVLNRQNLELTALIIDATTGQIVNANRTELAYTGTGIEQKPLNSNIQIGVTDFSVHIHAVDGKTLSAQLYNTQGILLENKSGGGDLTLSLDKGNIYILRIEHDNAIVIRKIVKE